jgi:uncharacterized protein with FMN-binding domain
MQKSRYKDFEGLKTRTRKEYLAHGSKLIVGIGTIFLLAVAYNLFGPKPILYKPGVYTGEGQGHHSKIVVQIETTAYQITDVIIIEENEMPIIGKVVYKEIPESVIRYNTANVNMVAGATYTSTGVLNAIEEAIDQAKINRESDERQ